MNAEYWNRARFLCAINPINFQGYISTARSPTRALFQSNGPRRDLHQLIFIFTVHLASSTPLATPKQTHSSRHVSSLSLEVRLGYQGDRIRRNDERHLRGHSA
jgi:hypothetical protein